MKKRIVIFASGKGTNTQNIIQYFRQGEVAEVVLVLSNKKDAKVLELTKELNVKNLFFSKASLLSEDGVLQTLKELQPHLIVLAGFLWKFPEHILKEFPHKVINIHPALLPNYGGKGMYGKYVHEAVVANKEAVTGITIHYVNEQYDEGAVIFQKSVALSKEDNPETVAKKVQQLERVHFPQVIEGLLLNPQTPPLPHSPPKHG
ncbi:phosphoribosylglycinamide formyltransferase [Altibacter lentus]|uniref:phosphoribosylglycinamide formyltransferase n=1 Tax=Altibacter lentus TaxID=1223410 RepID=UPI00068BA7E8|nr:phosphoribosylglycinamide formyltransferase [Altibacter lentus]